MWRAQWDGWCITRDDSEGKVERVITLPVPRPSSCTSATPNLDILYVTTACIRLSAQQLAGAPLSGSILAVDMGITGLPDPMFGG